MNDVPTPFESFDVAASALSAQRVRLAVVARNIANAHTLPGRPGEAPYQRQEVSFDSVLGRARDGLPQGAVRVRSIDSDQSAWHRLHRPGHPAADAEGYVLAPNVDLATEMVDLAAAVRSYEANLSALRVAREMTERTLELTR